MTKASAIISHCPDRFPRVRPNEIHQADLQALVGNLDLRMEHRILFF
jgi:hypothetical protein